MRLLIFALLQLLIFSPIASFAADSVKPPETQNIQKTAITKSYGKLPLYFIENKGQVDRAVKFYEKGAGHSTFFTEEGVVLTLTKSEARDEKNASLVEPGLKKLKNKKFTTEALRLSFVGANKGVKITSTSPLPGHVNYFVGNDKTKWQSNIPTYKAVTYENIYDNIDVKFYGNNRDIEHDIIVRPGADPSVVRFAYEGIKGLEIRDNGDLKVSLHDGIIIEKRPIIYQEINGERKSIKGSYRIFNGADSAFTYGYDVASYDKTKELVIDPVLTYSTYLGGNGYDGSNNIAIDSSGAVYVTGWTYSTDFPRSGPIQGTYGGIYSDAFITKLTPDGTAIVYSTYLGGTAGDIASDIAVDNTGAVYVVGHTVSMDFPLVNPIQGIYGGGVFYVYGDAFVTKLNPTGSAIVYSTYLGGSDEEHGNAIKVDSTGAVYVTGSTRSTDFPTVNPIQGRFADPYYNYPYAYVTKINPAGTAIVYSTYLGGSKGADSNDIAIDSSGASYVTGITYSIDFPLVNPLQAIRGPASSVVFITKIDPPGAALVYSTYLSGSSIMTIAKSIAVDNSGAAYITGEVASAGFPTVNPIQGYSGYDDAFVTKLNPAGSAIVYSTYLGGSGGNQCTGIAVDSDGAVYVTGGTAYGTDFPLVGPFQSIFGGGFDDITITKINPAGSAYVFSTYLGGLGTEGDSSIAVDSAGAIYVTGFTESINFPTITPLQRALKDRKDAFVSKITLPPVLLTFNTGVISIPSGSTLSYNIKATNTTATQQCFQYWENVTLPKGSTYPATGDLFGPVSLCLDAWASQSAHLTHGVPMVAPVGVYAFNAFVGTTYPTIIHQSSFDFDVTAFAPATFTPQTSWRLIENGLK